MLGYTNIDSEKGFEFFQKFLKENGIIKQLFHAPAADGGDAEHPDSLRLEFCANALERLRFLPGIFWRSVR